MGQFNIKVIDLSRHPADPAPVEPNPSSGPILTDFDPRLRTDAEAAQDQYYAETGDLSLNPDLDPGSGDLNTRREINKRRDNQRVHVAANSGVQI